MNNNDYVRLSLELHLFFDRIMKEHSFFIEASLTERDNNLKKVARDFNQIFSNILKQSIRLADGNISNDLLLAEEIVTRNTLMAENKTNMLTGSNIDTNITMEELNLKNGNINVTQQMLNSINDLNIRTLPIIENLIYFKNDVLNKVLSCKMYTTNYPLLIEHIMSEAKMYQNLLSKVQSRQKLSQDYLLEQELFWNDIMKEHAQFIRGLLDPSEEKLIEIADNFAKEYEDIIKGYNSNNLSYLTNISLRETVNFKNFKVTGEEGILNCKIRSIIIPLLADHVVREANHFIKVLRTF